MKIIGLTGGIGTGKSTVSTYLKDKGYYIIDADKISHQITEKGTDTLGRIEKEFGHDILLSDGNLDRKKLAEVVFSDDKKRIKLENITTRDVFDLIKNKVKYLREEEDYDIIFLDAPLLFETGADRFVDFVWLVTTKLNIRLERVHERDKVPYEHIIERIKSQMSTRDKILLSQEIIDNSGGKDELYRQVDVLLEKYDS